MDSSLTQLLNSAQQGNRGAENRALELAMNHLRAVARKLIKGEWQHHSIRATALVSEAFMRKLRKLKTPIHNSEHFYSLAAYAMRQVLIEHARARSANKRVPPDMVADLLSTHAHSTMEPELQLAVRHTFDKLRKLDRTAALTLHYCYIEGLTIQEAAARMGRPLWRVRADCRFALRWMADHLRTPA